MDTSTCSPEDVCIPTDSGFACVRAGANVLIGDQPCVRETDCPAGTKCVSPEQLVGCEQELCCTPYCELDAADPGCPEATSCVPSDLIPEESANVGLCL